MAGIAHSDNGKISAEKEKLYYAVNTDLAVETAKKAKADGVKQFIFMSSAIVYGNSAPIGLGKRITKDTPTRPANCYGDSKVQAENGLRPLNDDSFKVVILRPPMIYGKGSKGNYPLMSKMAQKLPIFPYVKNRRSMLYIENLCEFVRLMIENGERGTFWPQNAEYSNTSEMVRMIAEAHGKKVRLIRGFEWALKLLGLFTGLVDKAFGNLYYDKSISTYKYDYCNYSLKNSIVKTESQLKRRALMLASVASMIDLFNTDNIRILKELGYKVDVAANFDNGSITSQERVDEYRAELINEGIGVYNLPIPRDISKIREMIKSYKYIKKIADSNHYDIVHCHSPIGGVLCRLACIRARKKGTKVIYTAHGFHFFNGADKKAWLIYYPVEKICSFFSDDIITINKEDYKRAKNFFSKRTEYVPGIGVDVERIKEHSCDRDEKRAEFGFCSDDFVIMSTGQLSVRKNHEVIIRALSRINDEKVKYLIVGFGELEEYLKTLVKELKLEQRVVFAGYRNDVYELLHCVDCFAFPSLQEGLPVSLMEAMAAGLPIVCSRIRGNTDLINNSEGGYVYDIRDIYGFSSGISEIYKNKRVEFGKNNLALIKKYDKKIVSEKMKKIYMRYTKCQKSV